MIKKHRLKGIIITILCAIVFLFVYARYLEPRWVEWNEVEMPLKNLPKELENKTLVQISDMHIGDEVHEDFIIKEFEKINKTNPDIVIYTGDFISAVNINQAPYDQLEKALQHKAKGTLATIGIFGNHEYSILARNPTVADSLERLLTKYNIIILRNNAIDLLGLNIIGIDDYWGTNFYPNKALDYFDKEKANIALCHNPDVLDLDIWGDFDSWVLSGHTHGGQVKPPFGKALKLPVDNKDYDEGVKNLSNGRTLYINKGMGHSERIRFNVRPEVTFFTLKSYSPRTNSDLSNIKYSKSHR